MSDFIEKKFKSDKVFRICLLILLILTIVAYTSMGFVEEIELVIIPATLMANALWISGVIYFTSFLPFLNSVKRLKVKGLESLIEDISLERPTLPRSKIYCGQRAFFCKKPCAIIPYSEVAWVYLYERRAYGIAVEKSVIIYTKDGKKCALNSNSDEFKWLLENYIIPQSPSIVIGYGAEQKARYAQLNPEALNSGKKAKKIWGIVLMILGAFLLVVGLINQTIMSPGLVIILGLLGSGIALFLTGNKK